MKRWRAELNVDGDRVMISMGNGRFLFLHARDARRWARQTQKVLPRVRTVTMRVNADLVLEYQRAAAQHLAQRILDILDANLARTPTLPQDEPEAAPDPETPPDADDAASEPARPASDEPEAIRA